MGECKDCKWWNGKAECEISRSEDNKATNAQSTAVAYDAEGYHAVLITAPTFGCNQFEAK
jgi:hypothetical protein